MINFLGKINLDPSSDIWVDTDKKPDVLVNIGGDKDAWDLIDKIHLVTNGMIGKLRLLVMK